MKKSAIVLLLLSFVHSIYGATPGAQSCIKDAVTIAVSNVLHADTLPFAKVIIYRPDNQLTRAYDFSTNLNDGFSLKKKGVKSIDAFTNVFEVSVSAFGHKRERFYFILSKNKVHYFRVQDRNNYAGMRPFLEVIEVTEEAYKKDMN